MSAHELSFASPAIDVDKLRGWKEAWTVRLAQPVRSHRQERHGTVSFEQPIIAAGSEPVSLPFTPHSLWLSRVGPNAGDLIAEAAGDRGCIFPCHSQITTVIASRTHTRNIGRKGQSSTGIIVPAHVFPTISSPALSTQFGCALILYTRQAAQACTGGLTSPKANSNAGN
jgi:hypothetical protein